MAQALRGKTVAVTGASGRLGQALLKSLQAQGAKLIALSSSSKQLSLDESSAPLETIVWKVGEEEALEPLLKTVDILVINHGVNVYGDRTPEAINRSYEINAFSGWRLLELFLQTVQSVQSNDENRGATHNKEVWVNTSEAESNPALSPLYELSKRTLGDLVTLRRLDSPCTIRKLILGPFKSELNPAGIMSADKVAEKIVAKAMRGQRNVVVTINPLTFVTFPIKEFLVSSYFRLFTRSPQTNTSEP